MDPESARQMVVASVGEDAADYDGPTLAKIANGPLFDPANHFCPAGRLTWAETLKREAAQIVKD